MAVNWNPRRPPIGIGSNPRFWGGAYAAAPKPYAWSSLVNSGIANIGGQQQQGGMSNPYAGILSNYFNTMKAQANANSIADAATRDAAIQRAIVSYGDVPDFAKLGISGQTLGFLQGALNDKVKQLALQNTQEGTSVKARLAHANDIANRQIPAQLAGRGLLRSGQTGYDLGEQAQGYKIQGFDTLNEMLGNIEGSVGGYLMAERQRQEALAMAEMQAAMAAAQTWGGSVYPAAGSGTQPTYTQGVPTPSPYAPPSSTYNPFAPTKKPKNAAVHVGSGAGGGWI